MIFVRIMSLILTSCGAFGAKCSLEKNEIVIEDYFDLLQTDKQFQLFLSFSIMDNLAFLGHVNKN